MKAVRRRSWSLLLDEPTAEAAETWLLACDSDCRDGIARRQRDTCTMYEPVRLAYLDPDPVHQICAFVWPVQTS